MAPLRASLGQLAGGERLRCSPPLLLVLTGGGDTADARAGGPSNSMGITEILQGAALAFKLSGFSGS